MKSGIRLCLVGMILFLLTGLSIVLMAHSASAQNGDPRCVHNVCVTNCLVYQYILAGKPNFYAWYATAYQLTGCGDSGWITIRDLLVDVASELVGAPGGYTMQCWQMMLGQASVCSDQCKDFFVKDCRYAPNVRASLVNPRPGYMTVKVENRDPSGGLPEYAPQLSAGSLTPTSTPAERWDKSF